MKKKRFITAVAFVVFLLVGTLIVWLLPIQNSQVPAKTNDKEKRETSQTTTSSKEAMDGTDSTPLPSAARAQQEAERKDGKGFGLLPLLSAAKIEFYGKVIDQDEKPLAGVDVIGRTGSKVGFMQDEHRTYTTRTDTAGLFAFRGFKGDGLVIDLKKDGYNFESSDRQFLYSPIDPDHKRFTPHKDIPVVFQMWKSLGAEPMIQYYGKDVGRIGVKQMPIRIDLEKGKVVKSGGDVIVDVKWGNDRPARYRFNWSASIEVPEGGILAGESNTRFMAPSEGYQPKLEYKFSAEDPPKLTQMFYIKSKNGQSYSRVILELANQPGPAAVDLTLSTWLNPSGSRNLEYDPQMRINSR